MVVQFALDNAAASDAASSVKKKYLAARSREKKNSIFDYVHLSSKLLRKVRYGQSLDAAMQSPWSSSDSQSASLSPLSSPPRMSLSMIWRGEESSSSQVDSITKPTAKNSNQQLEKLGQLAVESNNAIVFGREIQLQAVDGGYLALEADGSLCKVPKAQRDDPRTLLTLFPLDPLHVGGPKARVVPGTLCFVTSGSATITTRHEVHYADAHRLAPPPPALRDAVQQHADTHGDQSMGSPAWRKISLDSKSWGLHTMVAGAVSLSSGTIVQLTHRDLTVHYEIERAVKRKYTPISSTDPEIHTNEAPPSTASTPPSTKDDDLPPKTPTGSRVWLQRNHTSSQRRDKRSSARRRKWDNLWFVIDTATQRRLERERSRRAAALDAAEQTTGGDDELDLGDDDDVESEIEATGQQLRRRRDAPEMSTPGDAERELVQECESRSKRQSVLNAHVFISSSAEEAQHRAARIILRFLQRVARREASRRAKDLIDRRIIRRTGKNTRYRDETGYELSTMQQLRVLQCFKPTIYGSQRCKEPATPLSKSIPGISMQGSKYPAQEANRFAQFQRDLAFLNSNEFQSRQLPIFQHELGEGLTLGGTHVKESLRNSFRDRDRNRRLQVQLALVHEEKPPFRFGLKHLSLPHPRAAVSTSESFRIEH